MKKLFILLFLCSFAFLLFSKTHAQNPKNYVMLSVPKSGSHLIQKLLVQLSDRSNTSPADVEEYQTDIYTFPPHKRATNEAVNAALSSTPGRNIYAHFNFHEQMRSFTEQNPSYAKIIMVRDPRDVAVSLVHYIENELNAALTPEADFSEKLMFVIRSDGFLENSLYNIRKEFDAALAWAQEPDVAVCRFENLCGPNGGGTAEKQKAEIKKIEKALGIHLSSSKRKKIMKNLWGDTMTFRRGKRGTWQESFSEEHKRVFKERYGDILVRLGYEEDESW